MHLKNMCWLLVVAVLECCWRTSSSSTLPEEVRAQVETDLMSLFGFKGRPKIDKSKIVIPKAMIELYEKQTGLRWDTVTIPRKGLHTRSANTIRSFTHVESPVDARFLGHHKFRLKFDISSVPKEEKLKAAELTLNRKIVSNLSLEGHGDEFFQRVMVHDILKPGVRGKYGPLTTVMDTKFIDIRKNGTLSLDIFPAVARWLENPKSNHGLLVVVLGQTHNSPTHGHHVRLRRSEDQEETWKSVQPLLFTYTDDGRYKQKTGVDIQLRGKRATKRHNRRKDEKREPCSRHKMYVDFSEVGWSDWIVAPPGYDAYHCQGECAFPLADHLNTTNHAIVQTLMNSVNPTKVPKTCCVPTQLNSISMLYLDDESKVVLKNYKEMVVIGCGCR